MKYYKIILNSQIIGVSNSSNCLRFQLANMMIERTTEDNMEYIECMKKLYHAQWMKPIQTDLYSYTIATIVEIGQEEYGILVPAVENAPILIEEEEKETIITELTNPADEITLEYVREAKINEMSRACNRTIENGIDVEIEGEVHHFSLNTQDQLNLITLSTLTDTEEIIPYHADGEICKFYTAAEMKQIIAAATKFKIYHTTYYNALKAYIKSLNTIEDINAVYYGIELPEAFQTDVLQQLK